MPRSRLLALPIKPYRAVLIGLGAALALAVLYWIALAPVQPLDRVPAALARLTPLKTARPVPNVAFAGADGTLHQLGQYRGHYVLVNLWAPWCGPCVRELPALAALAKAVPAARLTVLAINVGRSDAAETAAFLDRHHAQDLGVYRDSNSALERLFRAYGLPTTILIGPDGQELARAVGPAEWGDPSSATYFKALPLAGKAAGG